MSTDQKTRLLTPKTDRNQDPEANVSIQTGLRSKEVNVICADGRTTIHFLAFTLIESTKHEEYYDYAAAQSKQALVTLVDVLVDVT